MRTAGSVVVVLMLCLAPAARAQHEHMHETWEVGRVGTVHFPVTCAPKLQGEFDRAVAILHSFFYEESERQFAAIAARDPHCAMAWWGVAMSQWHPLWEPPDTLSLRRGAEAIARADSLGAGTERERAYIAALGTFYRDWQHVDHRTRALAYEHAMADLHEHFPKDDEATIFYALALNATLLYGDKSYANQLRAGALLEPLYKKHPNHPGLAHYLIHSYDFPTLAPRALPMAQHYAKIAPRVPHALHMPSHIFTRLGMWDDDIASNLAAAKAGREYAATHYPGAVYYDEVHSWDYLEYAYLQKAQDQKALAIRDSVVAIQRVSHQTMPVFYALSAVPVRYALERHAWSEAAAITVPSAWNWSRYPWTEATLQYARALGGARSGHAEIAREALTRLAAIRDAIVNPGFRDWAAQVEAQRLCASAWLMLAEGDSLAALVSMRAAAALEDSTEKRPVTPGAVLPARELLGDMLLAMGRPIEALVAYQRTLHDSPGRLNALLGAMRAARAAGKRDESYRYAAEAMAVAKDKDDLTVRDGLHEATWTRPIPPGR